MHCPSCGNESSLDQRFCRKCGFALASVGELIRASEPSAQAAKLDRADREARIVRQVFRWITSGMIVVGLGVLMILIDKSFDLGKTFKLISAVVMMAGIGISTYGVISRMLKAAPPTLNPKEEKRAESPATTKELDSYGGPISIPSVTEGTTELIGNRPPPKGD